MTLPWPKKVNKILYSNLLSGIFSFGVTLLSVLTWSQEEDTSFMIVHGGVINAGASYIQPWAWMTKCFSIQGGP